MDKIIFVLYLLSLQLYGTNIIITDLVESKLSQDQNMHYKIKAKTKIINSTKATKKLLFNKHSISKYIYYLKGIYIKNKHQIYFDKGYFLEGVFYMSNCIYTQNKNIYKAKKCNIKEKTLHLDYILMTKSNQTYRLLKETISLSD